MTKVIQILFHLHSKINCWDHTITFFFLSMKSLQPPSPQALCCISIYDESYFDFASADLHFSHQTCLTPCSVPCIHMLFFVPHTSNWLHVWSCKGCCSPPAPHTNTESSSALTPLTKNSTKVLLPAIKPATAKISFSTQFNLLPLKGGAIIANLLCHT